MIEQRVGQCLFVELVRRGHWASNAGKYAGATVVEIAGNHAVYVSQPKAVVKLIEQTAHGKK